MLRRLWSKFKWVRKSAREFPTTFIPPKPTSTRASVLDFVAMHPTASVGDWIEFAITSSHRGWEDGYRAALEARAFGEVQLPEPEDEERIELTIINHEYVPIVEHVETEPIIFTTPDGKSYLRGD